jgi:hypothetical protein
MSYIALGTVTVAYFVPIIVVPATVDKELSSKKS